MPSFRLLAPALFALALCGAPPAATAQSFSDIQRGDIEVIVRNYLLAHPEVLEEAMAELNKRQSAAEAEKHAAGVAKNAEAIFNSPRGVVVGGKDGDVTMVEFFDYNCGYCKRAMTDMMDLMKSDPKLKVVLKEFPVLGPGSVEAAQVAVAVRMQDPSGKKYLDFHQKLLNGQARPTRPARWPPPRMPASTWRNSRRISPVRKWRHAGGEFQARRGDGHERHAELRDRQAGGDRRGRRRKPQGENRHRALRQGDLLSGALASPDERPAIEPAFCFAVFKARRFIARSQIDSMEPATPGNIAPLASLSARAMKIT